MRYAALALVLSLGCGSEGPDPPTYDARPVDAPGVDAPPPAADAAVGDGAPVDAATAMLSVTKPGDATGQGAVTSTPGGLSCGPSCASASASFSPGATVVLEALPQPGSFFQGWTGACSGPHRFCQVRLTGDQSVSARFTATIHNLVFVTSEASSGALGGTTGADDTCGRLAAGAGLDGTFVAFLSIGGANATDRLGSARGFIRLDGKPVADTVDDIRAGRLLYPVRFDENGEVALPASAWTGAFAGGDAAGFDCGGWASEDAGDYGFAGYASGGPSTWLSGVNMVGCQGGRERLYCFMVDETAPLTPPAVPGKRIYVTKATFLPGGGLDAANALCDAEKPAGAIAVKALLATTTSPAADVLDLGTSYVRPDGTLVGSGADLVEASTGQRKLDTLPWQAGDGTYLQLYRDFWAGSYSFDAAGTDERTCNDWTSETSQRGYATLFQLVDLFGTYYEWPCSMRFPIMCVEQ